MSKSTKVSALELRRLLHELRGLRPDILIRFRLVGQMWFQGHLRISALTGRGVILKNGSHDVVVTIKDLNDVIQFEIDSPFRNYQPHNHYTVEPYFEPEITLC